MTNKKEQWLTLFLKIESSFCSSFNKIDLPASEQGIIFIVDNNIEFLHWL